MNPNLGEKASEGQHNPKSTVAVVEELRAQFPGAIKAYSVDAQYVWFEVTDRDRFFRSFPHSINHRKTAVYTVV